MASNVYAKACPVDSDKDWYHGELTRDQAEEALRASGSNCFLIRESKGNLVLSLIHHGDIYHMVIKHGPGGYNLSSVKSFSDLNKLVSYHHNNSIITESGEALTLGAACRKANHDSDHSVTTTTGVYCKGFPADLTRYHWYYGKITEEETISVLYQKTEEQNSNFFLVRQSAEGLILSARLQGWIEHFTINWSPEGYCLQGRKKLFKTILEMITHYRMFPVEETQKLGTACDRTITDLARNESESEKTFGKEVFDQFQVVWRKRADLPVARSAPSVVRIGDSVYVSEGFTKFGDSYAIMKYSLNQDAWMSLPPCPTHQHGLATLNKELIAIGGGVDSPRKGTNEVYTLRDKWMEVLPPMPTARFQLSTASHEERIIIAAGGLKEVKSNGEFVKTDAVEIYIKDRQWYTTKRLPLPNYSFSISIVGDTCYTLGGYGTQSCITLFTTMSSLLENAEPADSSHYSVPQVPGTWKALEDQHPLVHSTITDVDGKIIALGGAVKKNALKSGTKIISTYDFQSNSWVECKGAELPLAIYNTGVVKLADDEVMVVGGGYKNQTFSTKVYIGKFSSIVGHSTLV